MDTRKQIEKVGYADLLCGVKSRVHAARIRAGLAANRELIWLYWDIGRMVAERQADEGWGGAVIDRLSTDIRREFPDLKGFSPRNIRRVSFFYLSYRESFVNWPQVVAKIESLDRESLPDDLKPSLPTIEEIESELAEKVDADEAGETGMMVREWGEKYRVRMGSFPSIVKQAEPAHAVFQGLEKYAADENLR